MANETEEGASYLAALKRAREPQGDRAATAQPTSSETRNQGDLQQRSLQRGKAGSNASEKRRSLRYKCQGSAHLREIPGGSGTWATFTDISQHGCYLEVAATYRVGAVLALALQANGCRVETRGEVRVAYPNLGMGIFFTSMSDVDRESLRELVESVSRSSAILGAGGVAVPFASRSSSTAQALQAPAISDAKAAVRAMVRFFEERQILGREDFFRILRKSQEG